MQFKHFFILYLAAPAVAAPEQTVTFPSELITLPQEQQRKALFAIIPTLKQLLEARPDVNTKLALEYPRLSEGLGKIDLSRIADPSAPTDLVSMAVGMLAKLPQYIYNDVTGVLSGVWSLLGHLASLNISGFFSDIYHIATSFIPGLSR
jgi:hypothetical protein